MSELSERVHNLLLGALVALAGIGLWLYISDRGSSTKRIEMSLDSIRPAHVYKEVTTLQDRMDRIEAMLLKILAERKD